MKTQHRFGIITLGLSALFLVACYPGYQTRPATQEEREREEEPREGTVTVTAGKPTKRGNKVVQAGGEGESQVTLGGGTVSVGDGGDVTVVEDQCTTPNANATEECNGVDDDCDGQIDEGCGYQSGNIQVTLKWASIADLDLHVFDPSGAEVWYKAPSIASGGKLDKDSRGGCSDDASSKLTVENVFWTNAELPKGEYKVVVDYFGGSRCSTDGGVTPATISIAINGKTRTFAFSAEPGKKKDVLTFSL